MTTEQSANTENVHAIMATGRSTMETATEPGRNAFDAMGAALSAGSAKQIFFFFAPAPMPCDHNLQT